MHCCVCAWTFSLDTVCTGDHKTNQNHRFGGAIDSSNWPQLNVIVTFMCVIAADDSLTWQSSAPSRWDDGASVFIVWWRKKDLSQNGASTENRAGLGYSWIWFTVGWVDITMTDVSRHPRVTNKQTNNGNMYNYRYVVPVIDYLTSMLIDDHTSRDHKTYSHSIDSRLAPSLVTSRAHSDPVAYTVYRRYLSYWSLT